MSNQCYFSGCNELVISGCSCSDNIFMCETHSLNHLFSYGEHTPKKKFIKSEENQKNSLIDSLVRNKKILGENIKKLKKYTNQIINRIIFESNIMLTEMINQYEFFNQNLKILMKKSLVDIEIFEKSNISKSNLVKPWAISTLYIEKSIKKLFNIYSIKVSECDDDFAFYFDSSITRNVHLIDLNSFKKQTIDMQLNNLLYSCMCCKVDDGKYFVYGGNSPVISSAKLIDIKNKTTIILPSDTPNYSVGGCLFNEEIYIFGGNNGISYLSNCKKYNLKHKTWITIQSFPESIGYTSAHCLNSCIYTTGYNTTKVYKYDPIENKYSFLNYPLNPNEYKYIVQNFVVCFGSFLFELDKNENLINRQAFSDSGNYLNSSAFFKRGKFLYFLVNTPKLYRISLESKTIDVVSFS